MPSRRTLTASIWLVGLTAFLLVFGSTVRVHGAGLACPDWPLCFGEVVPAYDFKVYLEFGHRVVAGVVSLGFVGLIIAIVRQGVWRASGAVRALIGLAAVVLAVQVVLGGLTVLELLAEWTVASHLLVGNTFCTLLLVLSLHLHTLARRGSSAGGAPVGSVHSWQRVAAVGLAVLIPAQLAIGGLVAGAEAGLSCAAWPTCDGVRWFPLAPDSVALQVVHRLTAYAIALAAIVNLAVQRGGPGSRPAIVLLALVVVQIAVGVTNVWLQLPMEVTLLHSAGAASLMMSMGWLNHRVWTSPLAEPAAAFAASPLEAT